MEEGLTEENLSFVRSYNYKGVDFTVYTSLYQNGKEYVSISDDQHLHFYFVSKTKHGVLKTTKDCIKFKMKRE